MSTLNERASRLIAKMRARAKNAPGPDLIVCGEGFEGHPEPCQLRRDPATGEYVIEPFPEDEPEPPEAA